MKSSPTKNGLTEQQYHVALSFAGEDREYVEQVARQLVSEGVSVFYDKFEEANLWGEDLYSHLQDVYENKALFTVMFISKHYEDKAWPNHERQSAQARALESKQAYILPAFFDLSIKVPGLRKTVGHISLSNKTPEDVAALIVEKLQARGVEISAQFVYSDEAKADVDFPRAEDSPVGRILNKLKSHDWYKQAPAIDAIFELDWKSLDKNQIFVLGRNIYQCACGSEHHALAVLRNLRAKLAEIPEAAPTHLLNGMFFEVYFDREGKFRGSHVKGQCLDELLKVQTIKKFEPSISFIRRALQPYRAQLPFLPSTTPENVVFELTAKLTDPPTVKSLKFGEKQLLVKVDDLADLSSQGQLWKLSLMNFTVKQLEEMLAEAWSIPPKQLHIRCSPKLDPDTEYKLAKDLGIRWPEQALPDETEEEE